MKQHLHRQSDLLSEEQLTMPITVIGAGAIGSFTVLALAKMGFENITVFDDDKVEVENLNAQFFRHKDVGQFKVAALQAMVADFTGVIITTKCEKFTGPIAKRGIMITAVDNMKTRTEVLEACEKTGMITDLVIDPRMSAEMATMFVYEPKVKKTMEVYRKSLFDDKAGVQERCTAKSTMYCVLGISSQVAATVKQFVNKQPYIKNLQWAVNVGQLDAFTNVPIETAEVA